MSGDSQEINFEDYDSCGRYRPPRYAPATMPNNPADFETDDSGSDDSGPDNFENDNFDRDDFAPDEFGEFGNQRALPDAPVTEVTPTFPPLRATY